MHHSGLLHHSRLLHHSWILILSVSGHVLPHHRIIGVVDLRLTHGSHHYHLLRWVLNFLFLDANIVNDDGDDDTAAAASDRNTDDKAQIETAGHFSSFGCCAIRICIGTRRAIERVLEAAGTRSVTVRLLWERNGVWCALICRITSSASAWSNASLECIAAAL